MLRVEGELTLPSVCATTAPAWMPIRSCNIRFYPASDLPTHAAADLGATSWLEVALQVLFS